DNFLAEYNNGREYEKTDSTSERLRLPLSFLPTKPELVGEDSNFSCLNNSEKNSVGENFVGGSRSSTQQNYLDDSLIAETPVKGNFISDYLNSFQSALSEYMDSSSLDWSDQCDRTLISNKETNLNDKENTTCSENILNLSDTNEVNIMKKKSPRKRTPTKRLCDSSPEIKIKRSNRSKNLQTETTPRKSYKHSNRHRFKDYQLEILEQEFKIEQYPSGYDIDRISSRLGVNLHTITVWFQK
ncbi:unnamed protein product, partial [Brachionus calyciflorus]